MAKKVELLDCTLRDGAYITDSYFGVAAIRGIISHLMEAGADIIECGWLKDKPCEEGSTFYHVPADLEKYIADKRKNTEFVAMIDWDRYDVSAIPQYDGKSIDAVRVVFPHGKHKEGIAVGQKIRDNGYRVYFQAANTLAYSDEDLEELAKAMNGFKPVALSVVDTFGAMFEEDVDRIIGVLNKNLDKDIKMGFHAHNNQQLAFSLTMHFVDKMSEYDRACIADATLCGMGRGAGNATTELVASYLNRKQDCSYDLDAIMDAIDVYMEPFKEKYTWGYTTPYFIAGMYQCHVNNIAYLLNNHRTSAKDMRNIIESLSEEDRRKYDYDLLESKYMENQDRVTDDSSAIEAIKGDILDKKVLLLCPGHSVISKKSDICRFISDNDVLVIGVNAIIDGYDYDYVFFSNHARYDYAMQTYPERFADTKHIILSNIKTSGDKNEYVINYSRAIKRGWEHFDNAAICCLRLMDRLGVERISIAGFDGFKTKYNESYADASLPTLNPEGKWDELNDEITDIFSDFKKSAHNLKSIEFLTESIFDN